MKKRRIMNMKTLWMAGFLIAAISTMFTMAGCSDDKSTSITDPNPEAFKPKGTIQGVVRDSITNAPIVGAKVSVGVGEATTDEKGQYVIREVPVTTDALNGTVFDTYQVTVDLRSVTKPIKMTDPAATPRYPEISYRTVSVSYTSLNDTECEDSFDPDNSETCASDSNHDTPVDSLVASLPIEIGQLACNIKGTVYGCFDADYATPQSAEVRLVMETIGDNTGTGTHGNVIGRYDTTANGEFEFNNIECGEVGMEVTAADDLENPTVHDNIDIDSPEELGETMVLHLDQSGSDADPSKDEALHLCPNDDLGPRIVEVAPESGSDLSKSASQTVTITFHEPVAQNSFTDTGVSGVGNLYDDIEVMYDGAKAGNVGYTLEWLPTGCETTDTCKQLQVQFPTGTSSLYRVTLKDLYRLTDAAGNPALSGVCSVDSPGAPWGNTEGSATGGDDDCVIAFSTTGLPDNIPDTITTLALSNDGSLDEGGSDVGVYDWKIVKGAKTYVMECQKIQLWGGADPQEGPFLRDDPDKCASGAGGSEISEIRNDGIGNDDCSCSGAEALAGGCGLADGMDTAGSSATVDFDILSDVVNDSIAFVENSEIELHYNCRVAGVSSDGVVGTFSSIAEDAADDEIGPILEEDGSDLACPDTGTDPTDSGTICDTSGKITQVVLEANEELDESTAEVATNYVFSGLRTGTPTPTTPTVTTAVYSADNDSVTLTLSAALDPKDLLITRITTGPDGISNTTAAGTDTQTIAVGFGAAGGALTPCVIDNGPDTAAATGDVAATIDGVRTIFAGGDADCDTTAKPEEGDVQLSVVTTANGRPAAACVTDIAPFIAAGGGDDVQVVGGDGADTGDDYFHVGPNGICETTAGVGDTQHIAILKGIPFTTAVTTAGDGLLDTETLNTGTGAADDVREGGKVTVSGVKDVGGNPIGRGTGDRDEYFSDGSVR